MLEETRMETNLAKKEAVPRKALPKRIRLAVLTTSHTRVRLKVKVRLHQEFLIQRRNKEWRATNKNTKNLKEAQNHLLIVSLQKQLQRPLQKKLRRRNSQRKSSLNPLKTRVRVLQMDLASLAGEN